jgi:hypothetical protein
MSIIGPRMKKEVNEALEYVIQNLDEQYVIPACAKGNFSDSYNMEYYNNGVTSTLTVTVYIKNLDTCKCDNYTCGEYDCLDALGELASVIIQDDLRMDTPVNDRVRHQCLNFFGTKSFTYSGTEEVEICKNRLLVTVTYERCYTNISNI